MENVKLHIVVPGDSRGPFFTFLSSLIYKTGAAGINVMLTNPRGSDLVSIRTLGANRALETNSTHLLWVDSDIIMPDDAALRLLKHDLPIVAANYVTKRKEIIPVSSRDGERITSLGKSGLERVGGTGMGLMLTKCEVYDKMVFPWFGHRWFPTGEDECVGRPKDMGEWPASFEDAYFCDRAAQAGIDILIDHDLSQEVGHYGGCIFYHDRLAPV